MTHLIVALLAGTLGALLGMLLRPTPAPVAVPGGGEPPRTVSRQHVEPDAGSRDGAGERDTWRCELARCEQAVSRSARAVDTVSSCPLRQGLRHVVHRMEAELPTVRTLVELGHELDGQRRHDATLLRVRRQVHAAAEEFTGFADRLTATVSEIAAEPDPDRARERIEALRACFPLLPPMSTILDGREAASEEATGEGQLLPGSP
ncbi:hypothetical protein [Actinopolyspora mortivallis]|uniref:Uncharacterized protein n=1 Tax=Actinopolyspora mortivallis TaxID=33906 RepID=A0A2T0GXR5_ACTMO|nr:hypothetical protein [Actinopolyspora mortivallis]PRW63890.1 hypothetical protein CEP50_07905 [Actinopolyspora mortivallis]